MFNDHVYSLQMQIEVHIDAWIHMYVSTLYMYILHAFEIFNAHIAILYCLSLLSLSFFLFLLLLVGRVRFDRD